MVAFNWKQCGLENGIYFLGMDETTEKSTYIRSEYLYSEFEHPFFVSKQKPRDYPPCYYRPHSLISATVMYCLKS